MLASDLHAAVSDAALFAGTDSTLPMLNAVRLEASETQLIAVATDRFTLGVRRVDYAGESFELMLSLADVRTLAKMAKTVGRHFELRTVTVELSRAESDNRVVSVQFGFSTGESVTFGTLDVEFPKWRQLIPWARLLPSRTQNVAWPLGSTPTPPCI